MNVSTGDPSLFSLWCRKSSCSSVSGVAGKDSRVANAPMGEQAAAEGRQVKAVLGTEAKD